MKLFAFLRKSKLYILALPVLLILLGAASNQAVLIANHDKFPVMLNKVAELEMTLQTSAAIAKSNGEMVGKVSLDEGLIDDTHCVMTSKTHLNFLADVFDFHGDVLSIGDMALYLGYWSWNYAPALWGFAVVSALGKSDPK